MLLQQKLYTFDEFCEVVEDGQKADLIDGKIFMASPDNTDASELNGWLLVLFVVFVQRRNLGKVYASRVAFRLDKFSGPEPDIGFVKKSRLRRVKRGFIAGPPDLALEIVSPDSVKRDYIDKRRKYEKAGVPEYWIIDEMKQKLTLLRLDKDGYYKEVSPRNGIFRSKVVKGFWLRESWLWTRPLPDALETIDLLLHD
jgi:Uma2 family endonuclease